MSSLRVGVIRGGPSHEYEVSLETGAAVLQNLPPQYKGIDIIVDRKGVWHTRGRALPVERILSLVDVVFIALHGYFGEDGKLQRFLDHHSMPYVGSGAFSSALSMNKALAKEALFAHGIKMPKHTVMRRGEDLKEAARRLYREFPQPSVVKPLFGGSSVGVSVAYSFSDFRDALETALEFSRAALVEEYIRGREATCGVIDNFRGEEHYVLPPIEIVSKDGCFYDYRSKYDNEEAATLHCPSNFSPEEKAELIRISALVHRALNLRHYSRSDFIVSPRGIYFLEVNTLPGLTKHSNIPLAAEAIGLSFPKFLEHVIGLAR